MLPATGVRREIHREAVFVPEAKCLRCPACDEGVLEGEDWDAMLRRAYALYRERHALWSARELRDARRQLGLSPAEVAAILGARPLWIRDWEAGKGVHRPADQRLIEVMRDVPGVLERLRRRCPVPPSPRPKSKGTPRR